VIRLAFNLNHNVDSLLCSEWRSSACQYLNEEMFSYTLMCVTLQHWLISNESEHIFDVNRGVFHIKIFFMYF
jgi:hypothetical protein